MGNIVKTKTGLVHYAVYADDVAEEVVVVKRGRGRPRKEVSQGPKFDFSAFLTPVKLSKFKGKVTTFKMKG